MENAPPLQGEGLHPGGIGHRDVQHMALDAGGFSLAGDPIPDGFGPIVHHLAKLSSSLPARLVFDVRNQ